MLLGQPPQNMVSRNSKEKCGDGTARRIEPGAVANHGQENLLRDVFGDGCAAAHMECKPEDAALEAPKEHGKSLFVATQRAP